MEDTLYVESPHNFNIFFSECNIILLQKVFEVACMLTAVACLSEAVTNTVKKNEKPDRRVSSKVMI